MPLNSKSPEVHGLWGILLLHFPINGYCVSVILSGAYHTDVGRQLRGSSAAVDGKREVGLHTDLVPKILHEKRLKGLGTALNDERLDVMCIEALHVQRMLVVNDESFGAFPHPVTYGELRMFTLVGDTTHNDGVGLCPQLVGEHLGVGCRYG